MTTERRFDEATKANRSLYHAEMRVDSPAREAYHRRQEYRSSNRLLRIPQMFFEFRFQGSTMVVRRTVNAVVAGSSPAPGANGEVVS